MEVVWLDGLELLNVGYYFKNVDEKELYVKLASRVNARKKFSKYKGVGKNDNPKKPYRAAFSYQGKRIFVGVFETEIEAAKAWNRVALSVIGEHALLNTFDDVKE